MNNIIVSLLIFFSLLAGTNTALATGFDDYGYNRTAFIFNGTGESWALEQGLSSNYFGAYSKDKLLMKWNDEWQRGKAEGWSDPAGYAGAWESNEWNGHTKDGSGSIWHYKIKWVGDYTTDPSLLPAGSYGIWGQFAVILDHGQDPSFASGHIWFAHATPSGYGQ